MATVLLTIGIAGIFTALLVALAALAVFTNEARGVSKSLAVVEAFSAAPQAMQAELEPSFYDRVISPLLDRFVALGRAITPGGYADRIRHKLDVAGNPHGWTIDRVVSLNVVGLGTGPLVGLAFGALIGRGAGSLIVLTVIGGVVGYYAPNMYLYQKGYDRTAELQKALPDALDLLSISVEAGLGFDAALAQVARKTKGPLAAELSRVLQEMQIGLGRAGALRALGERSTLPDLRSFASAMVQADAFGIPVGQVLRVQSEEIRVKRRQRAEEKAQKVPVKILLPLMGCILPVLFIIVMGPGALGLMAFFQGV